jgi:O-succinylbenzoic acid--CoA ligase
LSNIIQIEIPPIALSDTEKKKWHSLYAEKLILENEEWIKDIYSFLMRWTDTNDTIDLQTSGSTGTPKIIQVKKTAMIFSAQQSVAFFNFLKDEKWLLCLPAQFIGGQMIFVRAMVCGANVFATEPKIDFTITGNFDFASMIPMQAEKYPESDLTIKRILIGGASVPKFIEEKLQKNTSTEFYASYGMTETISHIALRKINGANASYYFKPLKNILLTSDERGCLTIYNRNYSEDVINTNDLVEFNAENEFMIIGRADHIINSGGLKIIPETIEKIISSVLPGPILVIGIPDEKLTEKPILLIEGREKDASVIKLLKNYIIENIEKNKQPKEIVFVARFDYTESGKVNRKATRENYLRSFLRNL